MGYRIVYGQAQKGSRYIKPSALRLQSLICAWMLAFSLGVKCFWPEGAVQLRRVLLPEALSPVQTAAETLLTDLREGVPLSDAMTAFCLCLIENEKNP